MALYFSVEGPDGTGKSTLAGLLAESLTQAGHKVFLTKEPGSPHDPVCKKIRSILLDTENKVVDRAALFLFLADRSQHIELIKRKLEEGYMVISDRSSLSTYVYHVAATQSAEMEAGLGSLIDYAQQISPDLCIVCSAEFEWSMKKIIDRGSLDRIEQFGLDFHRRVHHLFSPEPLQSIAKEMQFAPTELVFALPASSGTPKEGHVDLLEKLGDLIELR
jgi:dTMP kinase